MQKTLFTSKGVVLHFGKELGKGGEGSVFEVPALTNQVAKIYHGGKLPDARKQAKLRFMVETADPQLLGYVAWPQDTLHLAPGGPVVGFLMQKVVGKDPVHQVYSPAHRRQERPKAAWDFLLYVARNTAAAFQTLHSHGHVLGDVNQGNILVGSDSKVVLIDSDSFQIDARGTLHRCEVGVGHFTPPELQGLPSFDGITRNANHDNFGLAVLIFHLLFGGRHPYAGVPLRDGVGDVLENDIKNFRYAYARDASSRHIAPPPRSIPLSMLPDGMEAMFHLAFTEKGASASRPSAQQWVKALDDLRNRLKHCAYSKMHLYPGHLQKCLWCELEKSGVVYFVESYHTYAQPSKEFVLSQFWAQLNAITPPNKILLPNLDGMVVTANPLPPEIPSGFSIILYRLIIAVAVVFLFLEATGGRFFILLGGLFGWWLTGNIGETEKQRERAKRKEALALAKKEFDELVLKIDAEAGPGGFFVKKEELAKLKAEYLLLPALEQQEIEKLNATAKERQKKIFLESFFIDNAEITGLGPARKAALRSFGIETAADVERHKIQKVRGFGQSLTQAVLDWRASCERKFTFNISTSVSNSDKIAVKAKIASRKAAIEASLVAGANELNKFNQQAPLRLENLRSKLEKAAVTLAQARKDLSMLE